MYVKTIQFRHTLHFSKLELNFELEPKPITLILGDQGSGKTCILRFTYQALTWFASRYRDVRTAGVVMLDQDIMQTRVQSKIDICVQFPEEIGALPETSNQQLQNLQHCAWQMYKTLNSQGVGISKVETQQLEQMIGLYQKALARDPALGLPLIAYYPAERFVNEVNLLSKNNPAIFQTAYAYEITAIPFTTFGRFFEWFREISDIENAKSTEIIQEILHQAQGQSQSVDDISKQLQNNQAKIHAPSLNALRQALAIVLPELSELRLQYQPKLQLVATYKGKTFNFLQLPNSIRNWVALIGDIVRRLCLLNPQSLFPCQEGTGILLIDAIDHQLDQDICAVILERLHQAFPRLQIIATGNRSELIHQNHKIQCLQLVDQQLYPHQTNLQDFDQIYAKLGLEQHQENAMQPETEQLQEPNQDAFTAEQLMQMIQHELTPEQHQRLMTMLQEPDATIDEPRI